MGLRPVTTDHHPSSEHSTLSLAEALLLRPSPHVLAFLSQGHGKNTKKPDPSAVEEGHAVCVLLPISLLSGQ